MADSARKMALYRARQSGARPVVIPERRTCTSCGEDKPAADFRRSWNNDSGLEARCRSCISDEGIRRNYQMSREVYEEFLAAQGGGCAICGREETALANNGTRIKRLAVDHDHKTGAVRGLLCSQCNKGIGNLGEDPDRLLAAATYLLRFADVLRAVI